MWRLAILIVLVCGACGCVPTPTAIQAQGAGPVLPPLQEYHVITVTPMRVAPAY